MAESCFNPCPDDCDRVVFDRVHVSYLIRGGTTVMWDLVRDFAGPQPWTFQLQVGRTGDHDSGEWVDVGLPQENAFYAVDGEQRVYGKTQWSHYRVVLTDGQQNVYYSEPTNLMGILSTRDWRLAREILRKEKLRNRLATIEGYLLKRRFSGAKCTTCVDLQTDEVRDPNCHECYGTGYQCGYYYPMPCIWADLSPRTSHKDINIAAQGTVKNVIVKGRMSMVPLLETYDVWVNAKTDDRYIIHSIEDVAEWRGVPLLASVEMRPAHFGDVIYDLPIPDQLARVSTVGGW